MSDPEIRAPTRGGPRNPAMKHQRRASYHQRRRSQHSIASFGEIADDVIKAPTLGTLGEGATEEHDPEIEVGKFKKKDNAHKRKSSNVHMLFGEEGDEQASMDNIVRIHQESLMEEEEGNTEEDDTDGYSPKSIDLEDAPESPQPQPVKPPKQARSERHQSFAGIVELFDHQELEKGLENPQEEIKRLQEENRKLMNELEKSNRIKRQLEDELHSLKQSKAHSTKEDEIERIKTSKIKLILAAVSEIDRMRSIILSHERSKSIS